MKDIIKKGLNRLGENGSIQAIQSVSGGDINEAFYVRTNRNEYFVKLNQQVDLSFFILEADGLNMIKKTNTIHVPIIYDAFVEEESQVPMLWMEWVKGIKRQETDIWLGERLAAMHLCDAPGFGFEQDTYIGKFKQKNAIVNNWLTYYRDYRLMGQLQVGQSLGRITGKREKQLSQLVERLEEWIPMQPKQSILHGDLWGGTG